MRQVCREKQSTKSIDKETSGKHKPSFRSETLKRVFFPCFMASQLVTKAEPI